MTILQPRLIRTPLAAVEWVGRQTAQFGNEVGYASALLFESMYWLMLGHWRNQPVRISAVFKEAVEVGVRAIPIVCIACFATGTMLAGFTFWLTGGSTVFEKIPAGFTWMGRAVLAGIPAPSWLMLVVVALAWAVMHRTTFGRQLYAVGGDAGWRVVLPRRAGYAGRGIL